MLSGQTDWTSSVVNVPIYRWLHHRPLVFAHHDMEVLLSVQFLIEFKACVVTMHSCVRQQLGKAVLSVMRLFNQDLANAAELDISPPSDSERLRRAQTLLIEKTVATTWSPLLD